MRNLVTLDSRDAAALVEHAIMAANALGVPQNIAVVDQAGALLAFHRMDKAKSFTVEFAITKAQTAAGLNAATEKLAAVALPGERGFGLNTLRGGGVAVLGGGVPVIVEGALVGAIGISSGTVPQDVSVANDAVAAFLRGAASQAQETGMS